MDASELPTDVEELKALLLQARQQVAELSTTVSQQQQKLVAKEHQIIELLKALRGKQRERVDPDQFRLLGLPQERLARTPTGGRLRDDLRAD